MRITDNPLATIRMKAGYKTIAAAAEALKVGRFTLTNIENGAQMPSAGLIEDMALKYDADPLKLRLMVYRSRMRKLTSQMRQLKSLVDLAQEEYDKRVGQQATQNNVVDNNHITG